MIRLNNTPDDELIKKLKAIISDIHNAATILQFYQRLELAQRILDAAGQINVVLNEIKQGGQS